jgi:hypothetical protein
MQLALEILGYPTYHTTRILSNPPDADMWMEAIEAKFVQPGTRALDREFWDALLGDVSATTDVPAASFHNELRAAYPNVKCVLVEREVEAWYKSWYDVQIRQYGNPLFKFVAFVDPRFVARIWKFSVCSSVSSPDHVCSSVGFP